MTARRLAIVMTLSVCAATIGIAEAGIPPEWNMRVDPASGFTDRDRRGGR